MNVKSPNNTSKWQMGFNSALKDGPEFLLFWENFEHSPLITLNLQSRKRAEYLPFMPINSD
jgi:hypothetical protein